MGPLEFEIRWETQQEQKWVGLGHFEMEFWRAIHRSEYRAKHEFYDIINVNNNTLFRRKQENGFTIQNVHCISYN